MVAIQGLKMNFRNKTIKSNADKMIKVLEEKMQTEAAMNKNPVNDRGTLHQTESWIDEVNLILKTWNTITHSNQNRELTYELCAHVQKSFITI